MVRRTKREVTLLGLVTLALALTQALALPRAAAADPIHGAWTRQRLGPGQVAIFWIQRHQARAQMFTIHDRHPTEALTADAEAALDRVPTWLQPAVYDKLVQLPDDVQGSLAAAIEQAADEDPRYVDEVAFCVAHIAREELSPAYDDPLDPELLLENVRHIYAADELLPYVELVELGDRTTTRYTLLVEGQQVTWELDGQDYYWWVVHPKTGSDHTGYVDPRTAAPTPRSEGGRFWRAYLMDPAPTPDYTREISLKVPLAIPDASLNDWGPSAQGWLVSEAVDPIVVAARATDGLPVWLRYTYHHPTAGGTNNGTVIAITMPVERAYADGLSDLLTNLLSQGDGVLRMVPGGAGNRVLVLKDRDPFGQPTVEEVLTIEGYDYMVLDSTAFAALATWEDLEALDVEKVVVPSDQPRQLYQRLSDGRDVINGWVGRAAGGDDMIFEFHGALDPAHAGDDWTDLELPGQLRGYALTDTTDDVVVVGYPRPMEVLAGTQYAWDGVAYPGLSGDRPLDPATFALDKLGWVVSQNLDDNVSEVPEDFRGPDGECAGFCLLRTEEAERVIYGHYGNCGENAHLWVAVGRMGLLPVVEVGTMAEDHVWSEILLNGRWLSCQTDWSDNATRIDNPGNAYDKDVGGSKDISVVSGGRGDGLLINTTPLYSNTVTFQVTVVDSAGQPADGARILVANEHYYDPTALTVTTVEFADVAGYAELKAGDLQNYYFQVTHPSGGVWPDADHVSWVACATPDAQNPGGVVCDPDLPTTDASNVVIPIEIQLDGPALPTLDASVLDATAVALSNHRLSFSFGLSAEVIYGTTWEMAPATHTRWSDLYGSGLDLYLLDQQNVERYAAGQPFTAWRAWPDAQGVTGDIALPETDSDYFLMVSNARKGSTAYHFDLSFTYTPPADATEVPPDEPKPGCGCQGGGEEVPAWPVLIFAVLGLALRRRSA
jgi:hypothetical protein